MDRRHARGMTLVELMIGISVISLIALLVGGLAVRGVTLNRENRTAMLKQQDMAFALRHFSEDVRTAIGLVAPPTGAQFILKQPHAGTYRYVTYRFADQKLQRGLSPSPSTPPTAWADVVDSKAFQVLAGRFSYFTAEGAPSVSRDTTRRIDLVQLRVRSLEGAETRDIPALSATMREAAQVRALELGADGIRIHNASTQNPLLRLELTNTSDTALVIRHLDFAWSPRVPEERTKGIGTTFDFAGLLKQEPGELAQNVEIPAGATVGLDIAFKFTAKFELPAELALVMHAPSASGRGRPYVVTLTVLPKHER